MILHFEKVSSVFAEDIPVYWDYEEHHDHTVQCKITLLGFQFCVLNL